MALPDATVTSANLSDGVCRVTGVARPTPQSDIRFEVRLPPPERWSGRYYQIGNGGFAGAIHAPTLAEGAGRGDVIAVTDTGHRGHGFDASWVDDHPEALADYGWRSIKATSDAARLITRHYYGRPANHHYFMGCSNGGRMALMAAARWPEDWDGVIAGAPANPWSAQLSRFVSLQQQLRSTADSWLDDQALETVRKAALASCPKHAVKNGIALRPDRCKPDMRTLSCRNGNKSNCLTMSQLAAVDAIVGAGYLPAAMIPEDWKIWIVNPDTSAQSQFTFADQARRHIFAKVPQERLAAAVDIRSQDLDRFRNQGGKVLSYFGWADAVIDPTHALRWYDEVVDRAGTREAGRNFYRLFMVPRMTHCQGGGPAVNFGQSLSAPSAKRSAEFDIRTSLEAWVENGKTPHVIVATDYRNGAAGVREIQKLAPL